MKGAMGVMVIMSLLISCSFADENFGQLLMAYYSGIGEETLGSGGVNAISIAFFDPTPLGSGSCDFTDPNTPCIQPASGSGSAKTLGWALSIFNQSTGALSANTSPNRGGKPTIYFSFGGASQGGACWDSLFGDDSLASSFGHNAAQLVTTVYNTIGQSAYVGFDLDVEGTSTTLPYISSFVKAFREVAAYDTYPLQLCALSGLANNQSSDHFKVEIMQEVGPAQNGINFLNMMVGNTDETCSEMAVYWQDPALSFLPPSNRILGVWGELYPTWVLHGPGCTDGNNPLFPWIQQNQIGIGIWQWWSGSTSDITNLINQIRSG
eukprot:TRINITY_DN1353_c0_g1_i2.p1 TRINITY_DN1353_c0_g1~~TRINITY_DN1353_c0_g1_i2.p1  ORF type:complete len:337 (+),score=96.32 TRINITY_DN1353_c0_g1_i2:47-1012(+)